MINFKITSLDSGFLTIEKPSGKAISLKIGEVLKADVMDILPSGGVVLKVKGDSITAHSDVPLDKGSTAFFKVTGQPADGKGLRLQFMGYADESAQGQTQGNLDTADFKGEALNKLLQEINLSKGAEDPGKGFPQKGLSIDRIENLIKALPPDINSLPKDIRVQLQDLLTSSLKSAGQSIQARLDNLLDQLPDAIKNHPLVESLKKDLIINVEKLLGASLKSALQNTGVVFEAKLKALALSQLLQQAGSAPDNPEALHPDSLLQDADIMGAKTVVMGELPHVEGDAGKPEIGLKQSSAGTLTRQPEKGTDKPESSGSGQAGMGRPEPPAIKNDLKAALLELKQFIAEKVEDASGNLSVKGTAAASQGIQDAAPAKNIQGTIEGLLKDIETFQALSRTTDSFYTFLPISWKELRDGEISFKRGQGSAEGRSSYSCRINLDLQELGNLSVMVIMHNRDFFVSFKAEKPEFKTMLSSNLEELKGAFIEKGLSLKAVNTLDKGDASFEQLEKLESSERIINIKA